MLHSHNHDTYTTIHIYMRKQNQQQWRTNTLYTKWLRKGCKRVMCERWVEDWTDCNILTPSSSAFRSTSFSFCWAAQPGSCPLLVLVLTTATYLQLTEPICGIRLYDCLTSTCFLWASLLHPIQPVHSQGYTLISSTGCTSYLHRCISYLSTRPRVNMLQLVYIKPDFWAVLMSYEGIKLNKIITNSLTKTFL